MDRVTVYAPGSVSNVGPGFDCLGIAFTGMGDRVTAWRVATPGVTVASVSDVRVPVDPARNTAAIAAAAVLQRSRSEPTGIALDVDKGLPLSGGLGGSAASAVAGAVAADALLQTHLSPAHLLAAALEGEAAVAGRHADNIAPSLMGGAVLVLSLDPLLVAPVRVHERFWLALVTPDYQVETAAARAVLPRDVSRADAVLQSARLAALILGLERGDSELVRASMEDRIAEPARRHLYPGFDEARQAGIAAGALGLVVSGAGPTLMAIAEADRVEAVARAVESAYARKGIWARSHAAQIENQGARIVVE